jgi:hypothetical protein
MFTVEQRDGVRDRLLEMGRKDSRLTAGAVVGSTASGPDRWSDLDLTFGVTGTALIDEILNDWARKLEEEFDAIKLFDLPASSSIYRVFLFPGNLQVDISFTPEADFGPRGSEFKLLFGKTSKKYESPAFSPEHTFGLAVHHLVRARICLERGRLWQTEYWISAARDYALALACHHRGLKTAYGRGFDDLPAEALSKFSHTFPNPSNRSELLAALNRTIEGLLENSQEVQGLASRLETRLHQLALF